MSGTDKHDPLLDGVAASISDGEDSTGPRLRRRMTDEADTAVLDELQVLDGIAQVHRNQVGERSRSSNRLDTGPSARSIAPSIAISSAMSPEGHRAAADSPTFDPERLVREAQRLARVKHPNVVSVLAAERKGNEVGVVMEWLKGQTLDAIVRRRDRWARAKWRSSGSMASSRLAAVHGAGLLHGDRHAQRHARRGRPDRPHATSA